MPDRGVAIGLPLRMTIGGDRQMLERFTACGITWDHRDIIRFLSKCKWESREELERDQDGNIYKVIKRCLVWNGAKSRGGKRKGRTKGNKQWYGSFWVKGKTVRAHKFAAVALFGLRPGPDDEIDHNCYNTLCVFCLECVPKSVNQARIRRGSGNATGKLSTGVLEEGRHFVHPHSPYTRFLEFGKRPEHVNCRCTTNPPPSPDSGPAE
jgi:hypothetical protein